MAYDVAIVGAGPAGSTAATLLARSGLSVCLIEKDQFPRHKVCGEFLSGDGVAMLQRLGLEGALLEAGAVPIRRCLISSIDGTSFTTDLPGRPLSISRFALDGILAAGAVRAGSELRTKSEVRSIAGSLATGFEIETSTGPVAARLVVAASGRSSVLDRSVGRRTPSQSDPHVAFKAHFEGPFEEGVVELHAVRRGYCGIQRIEDRLVNVCWVTRASILKQVGGRPEDALESFRENALLWDRLRNLGLRGGRFLAVSQLQFGPRVMDDGEILYVGDSAGMISPMCGDGISMAVAGAFLVAPHIESYMNRRVTGRGMIRRYVREWREAFLGRMRFGRVLHAAYERPVPGALGIRYCRRVPAVGRWLVAATRGV